MDFRNKRNRDCYLVNGITSWKPQRPYPHTQQSEETCGDEKQPRFKDVNAKVTQQERLVLVRLNGMLSLKILK